MADVRALSPLAQLAARHAREEYDLLSIALADHAWRVATLARAWNTTTSEVRAAVMRHPGLWSEYQERSKPGRPAVSHGA